MPKNWIINYARNMTKEDMYKYIQNNNIDIKDKDIDTIYEHIKKYHNVFFDDPIKYIKMLKDKIEDDIYYDILALYDNYKNYL